MRDQKNTSTVNDHRGTNDKPNIRKFRVNMPKKLGLPPGKVYYFTETTNGYSCNFGKGKYLGFPKDIIELNPNLYTEIGGTK